MPDIVVVGTNLTVSGMTQFGSDLNLALSRQVLESSRKYLNETINIVLTVERVLQVLWSPVLPGL